LTLLDEVLALRNRISILIHELFARDRKPGAQDRRDDDRNAREHARVFELEVFVEEEVAEAALLTPSFDGRRRCGG
jgi:hypothetical protein